MRLCVCFDFCGQNSGRKMNGIEDPSLEATYLRRAYLSLQSGTLS